MKKIIHRVVAEYMSSEEGIDLLRQIHFLKEQPGWRTYQMLLVQMGNYLANASISREFQKLNPDQKLVRLEAYSMMSEFIKFAINPVPNIERVAEIKKHNLEASRKKSPKGVKDGRRNIKPFPRATAARQ